MITPLGGSPWGRSPTVSEGQGRAQGQVRDFTCLHLSLPGGPRSRDETQGCDVGPQGTWFNSHLTE